MNLDNIANRLVRSAGAATLSQVWRIAVTFLTHMALRRMITPEEFGPWTWAEPLFIILAQFRDLGVPGHLVRDRSKPYGNYLALQIGWGGVLSSILFLGAPIIALAYASRTEETVQILQAMCLFLFIQGVGSVPMTYFEAELKVEKTIPAELVRNFVFAALALGLAWNDYGVWSLVLAHLAAGATFSLMLWWSAWGEIELAWMPHDFKRLLLLSYPLAFMSALEQLVLRLDPFIVGLRFEDAIVGKIGLATYAVFFFSRHLADPIGRALYPALVQYGAIHRERAFGAYSTATLFLLSFVVPAAFVLFANAKLAALFLGGVKWTGAKTYLQVLSLVPLVRPLNMFGLEFLLTQHRDRLLIFFSLFNLISLGGLGLYLTSTGLQEIGMAVAGYFPLGSLLLAWGIAQISPIGFRQLLRQIGELYVIAALIFLPVLLISDEQAWIRLAASCAAGLAVLGYMWWRRGAAFAAFLAAAPEADPIEPPERP